MRCPERSLLHRQLHPHGAVVRDVVPQVGFEVLGVGPVLPQGGEDHLVVVKDPLGDEAVLRGLRQERHLVVVGVAADARGDLRGVVRHLQAQLGQRVEDGVARLALRHVEVAQGHQLAREGERAALAQVGPFGDGEGLQ